MIESVRVAEGHQLDAPHAQAIARGEPRRQRLHLQIAAALEQRYASALDRHAGDLAHHLYQAGAAAEPEKTARYLALAADQAVAASAFEDALRYVDQALAIEADGDLKRDADRARDPGRVSPSLD